MENRLVDENFIYYPEVFQSISKNEIFRGTWQSELYFKNSTLQIRNIFEFNESLMNIQTKNLANKMHQETSISIHIRRGDYLSSKYINGFSGICTLDYYKAAIEIINSRFIDGSFYIFTDDQEWVNENFQLENSLCVQHNTGSDSWQDMYLMSRCKHNIIANSSFSWWGAWLNNNPDKIVIAPKYWWNGLDNDDVVPKNWLRI